MAKKKIIVADDNLEILYLLREMLEIAGYDVKTSVDGQNIKDLTDNLPDLILLDIYMSGVDGRDICKQLKSQEATKHIPVIMISAFTNLEKIIPDTGADGFLSKPFEMDELLNKVGRYLS